jgi:hypothetical protein
MHCIILKTDNNSIMTSGVILYRYGNDVFLFHLSDLAQTAAEFLRPSSSLRRHHLSQILKKMQLFFFSKAHLEKDTVFFCHTRCSYSAAHEDSVSLVTTPLRLVATDASEELAAFFFRV